MKKCRISGKNREKPKEEKFGISSTESVTLETAALMREIRYLNFLKRDRAVAAFFWFMLTLILAFALTALYLIARARLFLWLYLLTAVPAIPSVVNLALYFKKYEAVRAAKATLAKSRNSAPTDAQAPNEISDFENNIK